MKAIIVLVAFGILVGCTTMPKVKEYDTKLESVRMIEYAKDYAKCREKVEDGRLDTTNCEPEPVMPGAITGALIGGLIGGRSGAALGAAIGTASLVERPYIHSHLGRMLIERPSRKYKNIQTKMIFGKLSSILRDSGFHLITIDDSAGILFGVIEKGVIKKYWIWEWRQNQYATFVIMPVVGNTLETKLYYLFWVEEKPPLSSEYVEIKRNVAGLQMMNTILDAMDKYVINEGGEL